jgi:hypothetical protein
LTFPLTYSNNQLKFPLSGDFSCGEKYPLFGGRLSAALASTFDPAISYLPALQLRHKKLL